MVVGSNGVGLSQNLVDDTSIISMTNTLRVWGTITNTRNYFVNSTFQHAQSDVTFAQSQNYQFSTNGLGGVLSFNNGIGSKYDAMTGLSFSVNY